MDQQSDNTRILIATAGFGEGHNSAAKGLKDVLGADDIAQIVDPCEIAAPRINQRLKTTYRRITTYSPHLWKGIYNSCDRQDFTKERVPLMKKVRACMGSLIEEKEAEALLTTYFIYPYFMERYVQRQGRRVPVFTVVTDSIEINAAWFKAPCDHWFVTDTFTRQKLIKFGLPPNVVHEFGFPIHPRFAELEPMSEESPVEPFKVLYFPTARRPHFKQSVHAILSADPRVTLTIVLGRNVRSLYRRAQEMRVAYPNRIRLIGWTKKVPELLSTHHILVGKAGGATVHEAIAANCPMLVHHVVPGQEEGNLALLRASECGEYVDGPNILGQAIKNFLAHDGALWRVQKKNMKKIAKPNAAQTIANFVLNQINE